jgi:TetR/AcrR family transcriptional regulator, cholesterol catabolism regulator
MATAQPTAAYLERRADILRAAGEVFYESGYHAASMQKIADRAGILKPALYYYVRSKEDLLFELAAGEQSVAFIEQFVELDQSLEDLDGATRLKALIARWTEFVKSGQPKALLAIEREYRHMSPERLETVRQLQSRLPTLIRSIVQRGIDEGSFDAGVNIPVAALNISDLLRNLYVSYDPAGPFTIEELTDWHITFVLRGLGANPR